MGKIQIIFIVMNIWMLSHGNCHRNEDDYVDPTDLINFDPVNVRMKPSPKGSNTQSAHIETTLNVVQTPPAESNSLQLSACGHNRDSATAQECANIKHSLESFTLLFRQYVNKLVHTLEPKVGQASSPVDINLRLRLSYRDISKLRAFGEGGAHDIHDVHETLSYMVQYSSEVVQPESSINWLERKVGMPFVDLMQILTITFSIMVSLAVIPRINISRKILPGALFLTFVVSVVFTWIEMYQKAVADKEKILMTEQLSQHCPKMEDLTIWARMTTYISSTFTFQNEKCRHYIQAMYVNPLVKVSPLEAVAVAIVKTIFTPLEIVGTGIKKFFIGLLMDMPVQYQMLMIIVLSAFFVLMPFFYYRYNFKIFGLFSVGPSEVQHTLQVLRSYDGKVSRAVALSEERAAITNQVRNQIPMLPHPNSLGNQRIAPQSPQSTSLVSALDRHEGCCCNNSSQPAVEEVVGQLNDSHVLENRRNSLKQLALNACHTNGSGNCQIFPNDKTNSASGASLGGEHLESRTQEDERETVGAEHSSESLVEQMDDLIVTEDQAETRLSD